MYPVTTFHAIDDEDVVVKACQFFDLFVDKFVFPLLMCKLEPGATQARFRIFDHANGKPYLSRARRIIGCLGLPLKADLEVKESGGITFDTILLITYTGQQ